MGIQFNIQIMKKLLFLTSIAALMLSAFIEKEPVSKLNGAYIRSEFKFGDMTEWGKDKDRKVVKIFRDGYYMVFYYDDHRPNRRLFDGAGGGTYEIIDGKYHEGHDFYSWDSTHVGQVTIMDYKVDANGYEQYGKINTAKYKDYQVTEKLSRIIPNEPLKNSQLEGVWEMTAGTWGGESKFGEGKYKGATARMIFQYPKMAVAFYNPKTKVFHGAGIYTYQFDGKNFTEYNEGYSWDSTHVGTTGKFLIKTDGKTFTKTSKSRPGFKEVFKRIK